MGMNHMRMLPLGDCSTLWGEHQRVVWCTGVASAADVCNVHVYNKEKLNLRFVQIHAEAVRVECPALYISLCPSLIFPAYAQPVSATCQALSCSFVHRSSSGSSQSIYVDATSSKTSRN